MRTIDEIVRDLRTAAYAEGDGGIGLSDLADEIEAADAAHCDGCKLLAEDVRLINTLKAENSLLRASLKPVLDVEFRRVYGFGGYTVIASKPLDDAVREAKRIYNESEAK